MLTSALSFFTKRFRGFLDGSKRVPPVSKSLSDVK